MIDNRHPLYLLALASLSLPGTLPTRDVSAEPPAVSAPPREPVPARAGAEAGGRA